MKKKKNYIVIFIFIITFVIFFDLYGKLKTFLQYKSIFDALYFGELMKEKNLVLENCTYLALEQKNNKNLIQADTYKKTLKNAQCLSQAKLISIKFVHSDYSIVTFSCEDNNLVLEYSWTNFQESCSIIEMQKESYMPLITTQHINSP
ncbi:hypothetical protein [Acinetobacter sp. ANC 4973]|uniref:hypothetical protein n=1 Tax=Acinetobacter sp. ANC 4973 TaxID=1977871 RepID=UPI000A33A934|nr:hypothetical protein [Acinetobacter sp. ANC 4973]OTG93467.1 hypothetical protein B9T30_16075 [Acinetobacter sp. ANC 4973]